MPAKLMLPWGSTVRSTTPTRTPSGSLLAWHWLAAADAYVIGGLGGDAAAELALAGRRHPAARAREPHADDGARDLVRLHLYGQGMPQGLLLGRVEGRRHGGGSAGDAREPVSYTHLRAHETRHDIVCRLLLEK